MKPGMTIDQFTLGQVHTAKAVMTEEMIADFAKATNDYNPVHMSEEFAAGTMFKKRIAHGLLTLGLISGVMAGEFPGQGAIYLSQTVKFMRPVHIGDRLAIELTVTGIDIDKNRLTVKTEVTNQDGKKVLSGEAALMPPKKQD